MQHWISWAGIALVVASVSCAPKPEINLGDLLADASTFPRILGLRYLGQSARSNEILVFEIDFDDEDGDLDKGFMDVFINGEKVNSSGMALMPIFLQNEINPKVREGTLHFVAEIFIATKNLDSQKIPFEIGLQLRDARDHKSNLARASFFVEKINAS